MPTKDAVITMKFVPDKAPLTIFYDANKDKPEIAYTAASWSIFKNALATAKSAIGSTNVTVATLTTVYNNLDSAIKGLVLRGDKTGLEALYNANKDKVDINYTESSWQVFKTALDNAKTVVDNVDVTTEQIKEACTALDTSIKGLIGNKAQLQGLYDFAKDYYIKGIYTQTSWSNFIAMLDAAKGVLDTENVTYEDILVAYNNLDSSSDNLVYISSRNDLLKAYNGGSELNESEFTKSSWAQFKLALDQAKQVLDNENATEDEISIARKTLSYSSGILVYYADRNKLESYYNEYKDLNEADYTADSWNKFQTALDEAKVVIDRDNVTEDEFSIAYHKLNFALWFIIRLDMKVELEKMYTDNIVRNEADYTANSWAIFKETLDAAKAVIDDPDAYQYKVDEAKDALESAINHLVKKPTTPTTPSTPSTPQVEKTFTEKTVDLINNGTVNISIDLTKPESISKDIIKAAKEQKTAITFNVVDAKGKLQYSWTIDGKNVKDIKDINLELKVSEMKTNANIQKAANNENGLVLSFSHSGNLPTNTQVKVYVGDKFANGDKLFFYYFNETKGQMEKIADGIIVEDGYATVAINHCSDYILTKTAIVKPIVKPVPTKPTTGVKNPQTSDATPIRPIAMAVVLCVGYLVASKKKKEQN